MGIPATHIFNFFKKQEFQKFERHYIYSENFNVLRRSIREMITIFRASDEQQILEITDNLRVFISIYLSSPVNFDQNTSEELEVILGDVSSSGNYLGQDISNLYKISLDSAKELQMDENPMRSEFGKIVEGIISRGRKFKIFCTKREREQFDSLKINYGETKLKDENFIHTLPQYRDSGLFDDLIKIGPFRSRGWSSAPDAILTAPSFERLVQLLWNGCDDENGFGYDPVTFFQNSDEIQKINHSDGGIEFIGPIKWEKSTHAPAEMPKIYQDEDLLKNEFEFYQEKNNRFEHVSAFLIQLVDKRGVFIKKNSTCFVYNSSDNEIIHKVLEESNPEGLFLIVPSLDPIDFGALKAKSDIYSKKWKEKLNLESQKDMKSLVKLLKNAGVDLINLEQAITKLWIKPTERVIHAPHSMRHFKILLDIIGFGEDMVETRFGIKPFFELATLEIRRSRGDAIQTGLQKHEIIDEELFNILSDSVTEISELGAERTKFRFQLDPDKGLTGSLNFLKIISIESGFTVPDSKINQTMNIDFCDQWRD